MYFNITKATSIALFFSLLTVTFGHQPAMSSLEKNPNLRKRRISKELSHYQQNLQAYVTKNSNYLSTTASQDKTDLIAAAKEKYNITEDSIVEKPKSVLFLIHGLTGDATTFNESKSLLEARYSSVPLAVVPLTYPTGHGKASIDDFVQILHAKIVRYYFLHKLDKNTPFSFMAHSQGGLNSYLYILLCVGRDRLGNNCRYKVGVKKLARFAVTDQQKQDSFPVLSKQQVADYTPRNMQSLVCLGCPYGGSARAALLADSWLKNIIPLPETETKDMATGAHAATMIHMGSIGALSTERNHVGIPPNFKIFSIASVYNGVSESLWSPITQFFSYIFYNDREFDIAVDASAATPGFLYGQVDMKSKLQTTELIETGHHRMFFNRPHMSLSSMKGLINWGAGMANLYNCNAIDDVAGCDELQKNPAWFLVTQAMDLNLLSEKPLSLLSLQNQEFAEASPINAQELPLASQLTVDQFISKHVPNELRNFHSEIHFIVPKYYSRLPSLPQDIAPEGSFTIFKDSIDFIVDAFDGDGEDYVNIGPNMQTHSNANRAIENYRVSNALASTVHGATLDPNYHRFTYYHEGRMSSGYGYRPVANNGHLKPLAKNIVQLDTYEVQYDFSFPGWITEPFTIQISPSYRTYSEVKIYPYQPLASGEFAHHQCVIGVLGQNQLSHQNLIFKDLQSKDKRRVLRTSELVDISIQGSSFPSLSAPQFVLKPYTKLRILFRSINDGSGGLNTSQYRVTPLEEPLAAHLAEQWGDHSDSATGWVYVTDVDILDPKKYNTELCDLL